MAILCQASLLAPFFQHFLTSYLCQILAIPLIFRTFSLLHLLCSVILDVNYFAVALFQSLLSSPHDLPVCRCISNLFIEGHWALDLGITLIQNDLT